MTVLRIFASDLHLLPGRDRNHERFEAFCHDVARGAQEFYLLGDVFEAWVGDDTDDASATTVRRALRALAQAGTRCFLMHGNRDFLLGADFARACGARLLTDPFLLEHADRRWLLAHGDALCTDDAAYMAVRARLRDPQVQAELLAQPLAVRQQIAEDARRKSREHNENAAEHILDVNADAVAAAIVEHQAQLLLHGHTHRPGVHEIEGLPGRQRIVLSDWSDGVQYARGRGGEISLERFD